ncbi:MAG: hypothetical protein DI626_09700 [Micavibrio aeruginosavorus]|uniref:Uncharacterized protein n=1 Tax=Micavibrio aeruginosavorus TaxID=349221 RepID=A0A2W5BNC8_9BACT|nr:MAG: hypothetical protein DI626_09700 [Micavibrio aeruginosavorus]
MPGHTGHFLCFCFYAQSLGMVFFKRDAFAFLRHLIGVPLTVAEPVCFTVRSVYDACVYTLAVRFYCPFHEGPFRKTITPRTKIWAGTFRKKRKIFLIAYD